MRVHAHILEVRRWGCVCSDCVMQRTQDTNKTYTASSRGIQGSVKQIMPGLFVKQLIHTSSDGCLEQTASCCTGTGRPNMLQLPRDSTSGRRVVFGQGILIPTSNVGGPIGM